MTDKPTTIEFYQTDELLAELCKRHMACVIITIRPREKGSAPEFVLRKSEETSDFLAMHMLCDGMKSSLIAAMIPRDLNNELPG